MNANITIGDKYGPAMAITDQAEADAYFQKCVEDCMGHGATREKAEEIERINLGYYAGYCGSATMARVNRLFHCSHPVFGTKTPTTPEALAAGAKLAHAP